MQQAASAALCCLAGGLGLLAAADTVLRQT
jgi:hypothetical protein